MVFFFSKSKYLFTDKIKKIIAKLSVVIQVADDLKYGEKKIINDIKNNILLSAPINFFLKTCKKLLELLRKLKDMNILKN